MEKKEESGNRVRLCVLPTESPPLLSLHRFVCGEANRSFGNSPAICYVCSSHLLELSRMRTELRVSLCLPSPTEITKKKRQ